MAERRRCPVQSGRDKAEGKVTPKVAMAGSDRHRLTALCVKFSYSGLLGRIFSVEADVKDNMHIFQKKKIKISRLS
jgi:hypothetical protein